MHDYYKDSSQGDMYRCVSIPESQLASTISTLATVCSYCVRQDNSTCDAMHGGRIAGAALTSID